MTHTPRRDFIRNSLLAAGGIYLAPDLQAKPVNKIEINKDLPAPPIADADDLPALCREMLYTWGNKMLQLQITDPERKGTHGGLLCPACSTIHGRNADAILPLMYLYSESKDTRYRDAALALYDWMERSVSMPDGSWVGEIVVSDWAGISVFTAITLAETLVHFGHLLPTDIKKVWDERLRKAAEYLTHNFTIHTGNINYPVGATYALVLIGDYLKEPRYTGKGHTLRNEVMAYFTPVDHFIYGEGHPAKEPTPKGCYSVDLGYNVEESLPSLAFYARFTHDEELLALVKKSMQTHMEFMLPDGGWDNSWGTRNFKWTWWGSRTSDGCAAGFALLADLDPRFYLVALANVSQLKACTQDGLIHGGPHYISHGVLPCVHHTFCHSKTLALTLMQGEKMSKPAAGTLLPRAADQPGIKSFKDIQTWLINQGNWRATITAYDEEYLMNSGHATGGALSLLWHKHAGIVLCASMTTYQLVESFNQQRDKDPNSMSLTPRFELMQDGAVYTQIHDLKAIVKAEETAAAQIFDVNAALVNPTQQFVGAAAPLCHLRYIFTDAGLHITGTCNQPAGSVVRYVLPLIASGADEVNQVSDRELEVRRNSVTIKLKSAQPFVIAPTMNGRIFNFVPGLEAIPLVFNTAKIDVNLTI